MSVKICRQNVGLFILLVALITISSLYIPCQALNPNVGVVEGFYWPQSSQVFGQYGSYSLFQRLQLLQLLSSGGIATYWYAPQSVSTITPWDSTETQNWQQVATTSTSLGVQVVYGLRPGYLDDESITNTTDKVQELYNAGIRSYSLNFDDAEGGDEPAQEQLQTSLAANLTRDFPAMVPYYFTPGNYYQAHDASNTTLTQWSTSLSYLDSGLSKSIAFVTTGPVITPSTMNPSQFPTLPSGRRKVFWDNWIAEDVSTRIPWGLIDGRVNASILSPSPTSPYGYVLNLAYPLERIIHQLTCLSALANGTQTCVPAVMAEAWAAWLSANGFSHGISVDTIAANLTTAIEQDQYYASIADFETAFPDLTGVFSTPPTITPSPFTSSSPSPPSLGSTPSPNASAPSSLPLAFALLSCALLAVLSL